ncbi:sortase B protein-sorting domain-containing protein, partial [Microvirga sp. 3-52]|nr:sortase B protein-sorting domain-containing protein [Microvirga sp. 3-52]
FEKMNAKVSLDIPAYNYKETHDVQFAFDTNSIKLLKDGETPPTDDGKKTPIVKNTDKKDTGLKFNRDADANKSGNKSTVNKGKNPKTGDTTQILLFVLLLVGSLIPLAMKLRNRLAA